MTNKSFFFFLLAGICLALVRCSEKQPQPETMRQLGLYRDSFNYYLNIDLDSAQYYAELAMELADLTGMDSLALPALINHGIVQMRKGNFNVAYQCLDSVLRHPNINQYPKHWVKAMGQKGNAYHFEAKYEESEAAFRQILDSKRMDGDDAANIWLNFGAMLMTKKDFESAIQAYHKSDSMVQQGYGSERERFILLMNQAGANFNLHNYSRAANLYKSVIAQAKKIKQTDYIVLFFNAMAHCYIQMDSLDAVPAVLDSARWYNNGDKVEEAVTEIRTADYFNASGDNKTALVHSQRAFDILNKEDNKYYLVFNVIQLLFIKNKLRDPSGTPELIETVYRDCPTCLSPYDSLQFEGFALLHSIWQAGGSSGNYAKAWEHLSHIDGYYRLREQEVIHEQELKYQTAKKEQENAMLLLQTEAKSQQLWGLSLGLLFLAAAALALFYRNRQKAARLQLFDLQKQQLEQENRELSDALRALQNREISPAQMLQKSITLSSGKVLPLQDVLYLESFGDAVYFHTGNERHLDTRLLKHWEEKLEQTGTFLRIHKQYIINLSRITARPTYNRVEVGGKTALPVGRTYQGRMAAAVRG